MVCGVTAGLWLTRSCVIVYSKERIKEINSYTVNIEGARGSVVG
jgi:hypothetical protein